MRAAASVSSVSETSSPHSLLSHTTPSVDDGTMQCAGSLPATGGSSVSSDESPTSVVDVSHSVTSADGSTTLSSLRTRASLQPELTRIKELEQKRLALRYQRFSLEQRLYEFCGKQAEGPGPDLKPARHVLDFPYKDKSSGIRMIYSGPVNAQDEPHGSDGILKFHDGQTYRGDVRNGQRWGGGNNSWPDGQDYHGEWKANSRNGRGTHTWPDGRKVTGQWKDGHLNGKVYFSWPNGSTFDGFVRMGKKHGRGESSPRMSGRPALRADS